MERPGHHYMLTLTLLVVSVLTAAATSVEQQRQQTRSRCKGTARYEITLNLSFTPSSDPLIPASDTAQIPIVLGVIHSDAMNVFRVSKRLNDSVAELASKATSVDLEKRLDDLQQTAGLISSYIILDNRESNDTIPINGQVTLRLKADGDMAATKLSIMIHLSPSPAWFAGVDSFELCTLQDDSDENNDGEFGIANFTLGNFDAGLDKGRSFQDDPDPYPEGETVPVSLIDVLEDVTLAHVDLKILSGSMIWWKILAGGLAGLLLLVIIAWIVISRLIRKKGTKETVPLTRPQNVEW